MFGGLKRFRACVNAMNAKLTWEAMPEDLQRLIDHQARLLLASGGRTPTTADDLVKAATQDTDGTIRRMSEFERYTLYSMAMIEAYQRPRIDAEDWNPPRRPFSLRIRQNDIDNASRYIRSRYGIDVTLAS